MLGDMHPVMFENVGLNCKALKPILFYACMIAGCKNFDSQNLVYENLLKMTCTHSCRFSTMTVKRMPKILLLFLENEKTFEEIKGALLRSL